jgi:Effector-associated domain 11
MDRNYIVELIKENRLQEAIKVVEKAAKGSHLHNEIIMLSSSYSEYAQLNRSATQDFQTLEIQRAKITNSLLSFLDELSPEELAQLEMPKKQIQYAQSDESNQSVETMTKTTGIDPKMYLYGAGALLLLAIAYFVFSAAGAENAPIDAPNSTQISSPQSPVSNNGGSNAAPVNAKNVGLVEFDAGQGQVGTYENDGKIWVEQANGRSFKFKEIKHDDWSVYLRDESRGVNIQLDLYTKEVKYSDDKGGAFVLHKITHVAE